MTTAPTTQVRVSQLDVGDFVPTSDFPLGAEVTKIVHCKDGTISVHAMTRSGSRRITNTTPESMIERVNFNTEESAMTVNVGSYNVLNPETTYDGEHGIEAADVVISQYLPETATLTSLSDLVDEVAKARTATPTAGDLDDAFDRVMRSLCRWERPEKGIGWGLLVDPESKIADVVLDPENTYFQSIPVPVEHVTEVGDDGVLHDKVIADRQAFELALAGLSESLPAPIIRFVRLKAGTRWFNQGHRVAAFVIQGTRWSEKAYVRAPEPRFQRFTYSASITPDLRPLAQGTGLKLEPAYVLGIARFFDSERAAREAITELRQAVNFKAPAKDQADEDPVRTEFARLAADLDASEPF